MNFRFSPFTLHKRKLKTRCEVPVLAFSVPTSPPCPAAGRCTSSGLRENTPKAVLQVYIGRLSQNVREKDTQCFFSGYSCLIKIDLKKKTVRFHGVSRTPVMRTS